jgi:hypothetical protein
MPAHQILSAARRLTADLVLDLDGYKLEAVCQ